MEQEVKSKCSGDKLCKRSMYGIKMQWRDNESVYENLDIGVRVKGAGCEGVVGCLKVTYTCGEDECVKRVDKQTG